MKANEAPEKIILSADRETGILYDEWVVKDLTDNIKIEYTRTDAFIEKVCEWLEKNADKYIWYSDYAEYPGDETCGINDDFIEDFQKYMKGE